MSETLEKIKNKIIENLKEVYDPEIPINVYDLGLIYDINLKNENGTNKFNAYITMTLTSPTCPTGDYIKEMIENAVRLVPEIEKVDIELTFNPPWSPEKVSKEVREELGLETNNNLNLGVENIFDNNQEEELKLCFNCASNENEFPLIKCNFKGDELYLCTKCISKYN
jgi:metal-sulfur cluster biosynthetic enzyme